jgi:hypothetical protein
MPPNTSDAILHLDALRLRLFSIRTSFHSSLLSHLSLFFYPLKRYQLTLDNDHAVLRSLLYSAGEPRLNLQHKRSRLHSQGRSPDELGTFKRMMRTMLQIAFLSDACVHAIQAIIWEGPIKTNPPVRPPDGTLAALIPEATAPAISPQFCGWAFGMALLSCNPFSTCLWRTDVSAVGCCRDTTNLNTCHMYTTCTNYRNLEDSTFTTSDSLALRW